MAARKTNTKQRAAHLVDVARLYIAGKSQEQIAIETRRSQSQISRDVRDLHDEWRRSAMIDMSLYIGEQLERLRVMETELWTAWELSKQESEETFTEQSTTATGPGSKASIRRKKRVGNVDYMTAILGVVQERSKLLGLYPAEKRDVMVGGGGISFDLLQRIRQRREETEPGTMIDVPLIHALRADDEPEPVA